MDTEYKYVHIARKKNKGGKNKDKNRDGRDNRGYGGKKGDGAFHAGKGYSGEQKRGEFNFDTVHGLTMTEVEYKIPPRSERNSRRKQFSSVRSAFLRELAENHKAELVERLGLDDAAIEAMKRGTTPLGYNVHHKLPIHGGGKNEFSNFILTPLYPHDQWHHDIIDPQIDGLAEGESRKIMLPYGDEMIFDPKKYGFTKDNQKVEPNYKSRVDPEKDCYAPNWLPEHIEEKRKAARQERASAVAAKILTAKMRAGR